MARDKDQHTGRDEQQEQAMRSRDRQAASPEGRGRSEGDTDWSIERQEPSGFFGRARERRSGQRPHSGSRWSEGTSGAWEIGDESRGYSSGAAGGMREREREPFGERGGAGGYGGRAGRGYGRPEVGRGSSSGRPYGASLGEHDRGERGHSDPRGETVREREIRHARRRDRGPYPESDHPRHHGLPADLRAGEADWTQPGGYAELPRDRGGYEARYQPGEWTPGGDASVPLHMGYGDFGVRGDSPRRRWKREPVLARDIMTSNPASVRPESSLRDVARIMRDENTGIVPVCGDTGALLGVVTDRDIVMRTLASDESPTAATAGDVMTDDVEAVTPDEGLHDVVHLMGERQVRRIPVVDRGDRLVGIISMADVATRADYDEDLQEALEDISARRSFWSRLFGG